MKTNHFIEAEKCAIKNTGLVLDGGMGEPSVEFRLIAETGLVMYKELKPHEVRNLIRYLNEWVKSTEG